MSKLNPSSSFSVSEYVPDIMYTNMRKVDAVSSLMELLSSQETDTEKIITQIRV